MPCRLLVIASEDIGLAYPNAAVIVKSLCRQCNDAGISRSEDTSCTGSYSARNISKSNSAICAVDAALDDVRRGKGALVPQTLKDSHYAGAKSLSNGIDYKYPHNFKKQLHTAAISAGRFKKRRIL